MALTCPRHLGRWHQAMPPLAHSRFPRESTLSPRKGIFESALAVLQMTGMLFKRADSISGRGTVCGKPADDG